MKVCGMSMRAERPQVKTCESLCRSGSRTPIHTRGVDDLAEIIGHIASDDSDAASHFGSNLLDHLDLLARFPPMGANVPKRRGVRKLFHSPLLIYRINEAKGLVGGHSSEARSSKTTKISWLMRLRPFGPLVTERAFSY